MLNLMVNPNQSQETENLMKNTEYLRSQIIAGKLFPLNLYGHKLTCACEDVDGVNGHLMVYDTPENVKKEFTVCPRCNSVYKFELFVPSESVMMLFVDREHIIRPTNIPGMMFSSCTKEMIDDISYTCEKALQLNPTLKSRVEKAIKIYTRKVRL